MSSRDFAIILCRVMALFFVIQGILAIVSTWTMREMMPEGSTQDWMTTIRLPMVLMVAFGLLLWWLAPFLATRMLARQRAADPSPEWSPAASMRIITACVGLILIATSAPTLLAWVSTWIWNITRFPRSDLQFNMGGHQLALNLASLALGLGLFLGSRALGEAASRFRTLGLKKNS